MTTTKPRSLAREELKAEEAADLALLAGKPLVAHTQYFLRKFGLTNPRHHLLRLRNMVKTQRFRNLNTPFRKHGYHAPRTVGKIMEHRSAHPDLSFHEWQKIYLVEALPYTNLVYLAERVNFEQGLNDLQFALDVLYMMIVVQTDDGFKGEVANLAAVLVHDETVRPANLDEDHRFHLDAVSDFYGYQFKPTTFVKVAGNNIGLRKDQLNNLRSQLEWERLTGCEVLYVITQDVANGIWDPMGLALVAFKCGLGDEFAMLKRAVAANVTLAA